MPREEPEASGSTAADIKVVLGSLKTRASATVVGILDGASGHLHASSEASASAFWKAFDLLSCMPTDWGDWDLELLGSAYARKDCLCGAHRVDAHTIHDRWILIVLATDSLAVGAEINIDHAMEVLKQLLPAPPIGRWLSTAAGGGPLGGGGDQGPAELGIPAWWIRDRKRN